MGINCPFGSATYHYHHRSLVLSRSLLTQSLFQFILLVDCLHINLKNYLQLGILKVVEDQTMASLVRPTTNSFVCKIISFRKEHFQQGFPTTNFGVKGRFGIIPVNCALERSSNSSDGKKGGLSNSNYVVPLDNSFPFSNSSCITRPLAEILRDLNKRIPDTIVKSHIPGDDPSASTFIPWYHANRMLSFYAPGWCGEIRDVIFSDNGSVTVVYRLTVRGSDGEAYRESTGTISPNEGSIGDPVSAAEEIAFCKACARFGLGLYLYHEDQMPSV